MEKTDKQIFIANYIKDICSVLCNLPLMDLVEVMNLLEGALRKRRTIFIAGNGGSAATALHMASDLMHGVCKKGKRGCRVVPLVGNISVLTAIANDLGYREVFSGQLTELAQKNDILIVFSASGNSGNIISAIKSAKKMGLEIVAFLGKGGGQAKKIADISVVVPSSEYGPIEDVHMLLEHLITSYLRKINV